MDQNTPKTAQKTDWIAAGEALLPDTIALRRAIHQEPEQGLFTPRTTEKAREALKGLPLEFREGPSTSGFVAVLRGGSGNGRTVLLRGDMDALPLNEETGLEFASRNPGSMHACGHDTHTAMLAGAARALAARREALAGTVLFMFQPGEEGHHGAREMLKDGLIDPRPDAAFALHVSPNVPSGVLAGRPGPLLAAADKFVIKITGQGGHASQPHDAIDPIPVACEIVTALQAMVTRRVPVFDPVMLTVARITSGTTNNIIPETAELEGTIRSFSESSRRIVHEGVERVAQNLAAAHKCEAAVTFVPGFPVTVCAPDAFAFARQTAHELFGEGSFVTLPAPVMGAEDFSYVLQQIPGVMLMLGATPEGANPSTCCALHSNKMMIDEKVMARGIAMHCAFAEAFLSEGFAT